jgi:hypothetical protein
MKKKEDVERQAYEYFESNPDKGRFEVQVDGRTVFGETAAKAMGYIPGEWELQQQLDFAGLEVVIRENYRTAGFGVVELKAMKSSSMHRKKRLACDANSVTHVYMPAPTPVAKNGEVQKASYDLRERKLSLAMATRLRKARITRTNHLTEKGHSSMTQALINADYVTPEGVWRLNEYARSLVPEFDALYCRTEDREGRQHKLGVYDNCACTTQP